MDPLEKVAVLHDEIEAQLVDALLSEQGIPHLMRSYHDSAYNGLFQGAGHWGHVEAPLVVHEQVKTLIEELRRQVAQDSQTTFRTTAAPPDDTPAK